MKFRHSHLIGLLCLLSAFLLVPVVLAAPPAAYTNIITNGDFSLGFSSWTRGSNMVWDVLDEELQYYVPSGSGNFSQVVSYTATTGDIYELNVWLGNSSGVSKSIRVRVDGNDANLIQCDFTIPAASSLQHYRMRGLAPANWTSIRFIALALTIDSLPAVRVDNVSLQYTPGAVVSTTVCDAPPPTATPTPTSTPTAFPARQSWLLTPQFNDQGTPEPAQQVEFSYSATAGDLLTAALLLILIVVIVAFITASWLGIVPASGASARRSGSSDTGSKGGG